MSLPIAERKGVEELKEKANALEKELSRTVAGYSEAMRQVNWQDVQLHLKDSEVTIEFISFKNDFPKTTDSIMYAALLLKSGDKQPQFIPLFEEKSLDSLLHSKSARKADYVNALYSLSDRGAVANEAPKKSLYEILWEPLEKELAGIKTIYFSPSGLLHRINLDAIPISETETLADRYQLIELNSTRQLVFPTQIKNVNNEAVLYGGVQFDQDSIVQNNEPLIASRSRGELSFSSVESTLRGGTWNYLAGTEREVNAIEKIMQTAGLGVSLKKGYLATEESFKNIGEKNAPSPRILHIATHGYFFPDPKNNQKTNGLADQNESVCKISDHPMLRSGLIMAGGNSTWQGKQTLEGREDGILTAYEISQMKLSNTELVVLSACETGLGDIQGNEGVYGLQRAFKIAGAKYLIMSLWQVPDKQTSLLMTTFYKKWLEDKMTIPDAFHAAQKELRDNGLDPYNWAGFVLVE
ncbi:MAG: CHAT domain-containing protein [Saprospiraceae bacterium]